MIRPSVRPGGIKFRRLSHHLSFIILVVSPKKDKQAFVVPIIRSMRNFALITIALQLTLISLLVEQTTINCVSAESSSPPATKPNMGNNIVRMATYSISQNEQNALSVLNLHGTALQWFRLDDGVMGGQSETVHVVQNDALHFDGTINTQGGGFCSIRAKFPAGLLRTEMKGLKVRYRGDGKTYKVILGKGERGGPFSSTPSWQLDLPTTPKQVGDKGWDEAMIPFDKLHASFGGGPRSKPSQEEVERYVFDPLEMKEMGLMLSLKLSDGRSNPPETFGTGIFPFSLVVQSITTY